VDQLIDRVAQVVDGGQHGGAVRAGRRVQQRAYPVGEVGRYALERFHMHQQALLAGVQRAGGGEDDVEDAGEELGRPVLHPRVMARSI